MRAVTATLGLIFSVLILMFSGDSPDSVVGFLGLLASLALMIHRQAGFVLMFLPLAASVVGIFTVSTGYILYVVVYGLLTWAAYRIVKRHEAQVHERMLAAERAERHDRYIRQQLGE